jgi:two-component system, NtrC family, nitrogen regulation response regulator NtrX
MQLREARPSFEARWVAVALKRHGGNITRTAGELGISRIALQKKVKELGLR